MHNYFTIETEAEARRHEFERMAAADVRAARAAQPTPVRRLLSRFARASNAPIRSTPSMPDGALLELRRVPRPVAC